MTASPKKKTTMSEISIWKMAVAENLTINLMIPVNPWKILKNRRKTITRHNLLILKYR